MTTRSVLGVLLILAAIAAVPAVAQQSAPGPVTVARRSDEPGRGLARVGVRGTTVMGFAWTATNDPIANATVRLRNVLTGVVEATTTTNTTGEFVFQNVEGGSTYVVELLGDDGRVRAVGHPFTVAPGETVATFVRLAVPAPWFTGMFGNTAAGAVSTAAALGVAAIAPSDQPMSATR